jgi:hypothetical protein
LTAAALLLAILLWQQMPALGMEGSGTDATAPRPAVLVELFTSEGCSSCPAADALLRRIDGTKITGGSLIVGISEHVTYWNHLGWSDPYSSETYTERQNAYGERFHLDSVYTPQMVINGSEQIVGSNESALADALEKESRSPQISLRISSTSVSRNMLTINFSAHGIEPGHGIEIMAVLADNVDRSSVLRGENSGRVLAHVAVARLMRRVATLRGDAEKTVQVPLPAGFAATPGAGHHLVLFAQGEGMARVLGTDTKPL